MKNTILITLLLSIISTISFGQVENDSIVLKKLSGKNYYYINNEIVDYTTVKGLIKINEIAYKKLKTSRNNNSFSQIIAGSGGFLIGYPIGQMLGGEQKPLWSAAAVGLVFIGIAIPISIRSQKQLKAAVETYNSGLQTTSLFEKTEFELVGSTDGIGIRISF